MIKIAICDDEMIAVRWLQDTISTAFKEYSVSAQITLFNSGLELRKKILEGSIFDVIFLDINMPDINGIFLARHLKDISANSLVVFVSSQENEVYHSFSAAPFRFLPKSRIEADLPLIVHDIILELKKRNAADTITIKCRQSYISLNPYKIIYVESFGKKQLIHTTSKTIEVNCRLKELQTSLESFGFLKPHNSFLVNYRFITVIQQTELLLDTNEKIPISRHRLSAVKEVYLTLIS